MAKEHLTFWQVGVMTGCDLDVGVNIWEVWSEVGEPVRSRYRARAGSETKVTNATSPVHVKKGREITFSTNMRLEIH